LAARFGIGLWWRFDQALGLQSEAIVPRQKPPRFSVEQAIVEPLVRMEDVLTVAEQLAQHLILLMTQQGAGARNLELLLFRLDGKVQHLTAGTSQPLRDPAFIRRLFADRLTTCEDEYDPGFGYDLVRLSAFESETLTPIQEGLSDRDSTQALARLIDRLTARLGEQKVLRLTEKSTHIPEAACIGLPARQTRSLVALSSPPQDTLLAARPLRLFAHPQLVDAMAEVPDGPPIRFRWRRVLHEVIASEGPERIAMEWWHNAQDGALTRDYFRVACKNNARFWLYREGLYGEAQKPRWFLHGLFA
jgi:protein ImuB